MERDLRSGIYLGGYYRWFGATFPDDEGFIEFFVFTGNRETEWVGGGGWEALVGFKEVAHKGSAIQIKWDEEKGRIKCSSTSGEGKEEGDWFE